MPTPLSPSVYHPAPNLPATWERVVLPMDKPKGWSSFDVIRKLRGMLRIKKMGHAGTLDPMATGLLIVLVGKATKLQDGYMGKPKSYTGTLRLGEVTPSYDAESEVTERSGWQHLTETEILAARTPFLGEIEQRPPMYSAIKIGGERLYKKARRGETVERPPRRVTITRFEITGIEGPDVSFVVDCSKGTYIRSLAHDLGRHLGVGAHLTALRRTAIGAHSVEEAWTIDALGDALKQQAST